MEWKIQKECNEKKKQKQHNHQNIETEKIKYLGTTIAKDAFFL